MDDAKMPLIFAGGEFAELAERVRGSAAISVQVIKNTLTQWSSGADGADPGIPLNDGATTLPLYVRYPPRLRVCRFPWRRDELVPRRRDGAVRELELR